ncbi:hypothetical protein GCM10027063_10170 [Promicromonospora xylanilytica]
MFTGVVHDLLELVLQADPELDAAMCATSIETGPVSLQADLLNRGVSLSMGLAMFAVGLLLWMIATALEAPSRWMRTFGVVALVSSAAPAQPLSHRRLITRVPRHLPPKRRSNRRGWRGTQGMACPAWVVPLVRT